MNEFGRARPVGASLLALMAILVSLLGWLAVLSLLLKAGGEGLDAGQAARLSAMLILSGGFAAAALGLWKTSPWNRGFTLVQYALIIVAALLSAVGSGVVELGAVLVLGLAFLVNSAVFIYLKIPGS
jgi:hypothetical protein